MSGTPIAALNGNVLLPTAPQPAIAQGVNLAPAAEATQAQAVPFPSPAIAAPVPALVVDPVSTAPSPDDVATPVPVVSSDANPSTAAAANSNQTTQAPRKRSIADLPMLTTVAAAPAQPAAALASPVTPLANAPKPDVPAATTPAPAASQEAPAIVNSQGEAKVAFTAVLTPMTATQAINPGQAQAPQAVPSQIAAPQEPASGAPASTIPAVLAAPGNPSQPPATPCQGPQTAAQAGGDTQQSADPSSQQPSSQQQPSQQENDSPGTPARPIVPASDTKIKAAGQPEDSALEAAASAVHDRSSSIAFFASPADSTHAIAATPASAPAAGVTPYNATAEALRTTESNLAAAPQPRSGAAQEIAIRIAPPDSPAVDLRVVERSGQVHVDVRTPDAAMQTSLRQDLGTLTNSLERAGYHTETFTPSSTLGRAAAAAQTANQNNQQDPSQNRGGAGDFSGGRRQQQQPKRPGTWLEEFEEQP